MNNKTKGILFLMGSAFCFSCMSAMIRLVGTDIPVYEKAFFRNFIALIIVSISLFRSRTPLKIGRENLLPVLLRVICGTTGLICNFYAVDHLALADANMLNKLSPFFATAFSVPVLKEKVKLPQVLLLVGALLGAMLIVRPTGQNLLLGPSLIALIGGMAAGGAYTFLRRATQGGVRGQVLVFCFSAFSSLAVIPMFAPVAVMPNLQQLILLLLCGAFGAGGQFLITAAYSYAPAKEISVYDYSQILFAAMLGFFLFGEIPDLLSFAGYAVVILMAILNFLYILRQPPAAAESK